MNGFSENLEPQLSAYLDGELSPAEAREVEALLADSAEARGLLEELRSISARVAALPRIASPMPLDAWAREPQVAGVEAPARARSPRVVLFRIASRITAAAALIGVGMFAAWMLPSRTVAPHGLGGGSETRGVSVFKQDAPVPAPSAAPATETAAARAPAADTGPTVVLRSDGASDPFAAYRMTDEAAWQTPVAAVTPTNESFRAGAMGLDRVSDALSVSSPEVQGPAGSAPTVLYAAPDVATPTLELVVLSKSTEQYKQLQTTVEQWASGVPPAEPDRDGNGAMRKMAEKDGPVEPDLTRFWDLVRRLEEQTGNEGRVAFQMRFAPQQIPQVQSFIDGAGVPLGQSLTGALEAAEGAVVSGGGTAGDAAASRPAAGRRLDNLGYVGAGDESKDRDQPEEVYRAEARRIDDKRGFAGDSKEKAEAKTAAASKPEGRSELDNAPASDLESSRERAGGAALSRGGRTKTPAAGASPPPQQPAATLADPAARPVTAAPRSQPVAESALREAELPAPQPAGPDLFKQFRDVTGAIGQGADRILRFAIEKIEEDVRRGRWSQREALGGDAAFDDGAAAPLKLRVTVVPPTPASAPATPPAGAPR